MRRHIIPAALFGVVILAVLFLVMLSYGLLAPFGLQ